jgi:S1-C subfamily serine protease
MFRKGLPLQAGEWVSTFQIAAPVHKGNSGGPILGQTGNVTGIVSAKSMCSRCRSGTGDLPQNISFGIKAEVVGAPKPAAASGVSSRRQLTPRGEQ